jgi:hypothetical protein
MVMPALGQAQTLAAQFAPKPPVDPTAQAQIAGQQAIAKLNSDASMLVAQKQAEQRSADAEREREFKLQNAEQERMFKRWLEESKQDANDRATVMATSIEDHALETQRALAEFNAAQLAQREADAQRAENYRLQLKADNDAHFAVLQTFLQQSAQALVPQQQDVGAIIQPIIADMQQTTAAMMQQLAQGLNGLHAAQSAPRVARYIKDELGNNVGVESIIKGSQS